jgi:hypothetical protein
MSILLLMAVALVSVLPLTPHTSALSDQAQSASSEPSKLTAADVAVLVDECGARTTRMASRVYDYTYTETVTEYEADKRERIKREKSKTYEVSPVAVGRGMFIYVQVGENGVPLSRDKVEHERERAMVKIAEAERKADRTQAAHTDSNRIASAKGTPKKAFASFGIGVQQRKFGGAGKTVWYVRPTDFFASHEFYAPRRAMHKNRETILLSFRPRPGYVYDKTTVPFKDGVEDFGRVMALLGGRVWIDAADKVIARLEAAPMQELNQAAASDVPNADMPLEFELTRLATGMWVPTRSRYNSYGRESVFWKTGMGLTSEYSDFKLFSTSSEVLRPDAPQTLP